LPKAPSVVGGKCAYRVVSLVFRERYLLLEQAWNAMENDLSPESSNDASLLKSLFPVLPSLHSSGV
jgi:hypothetical protein